MSNNATATIFFGIVPIDRKGTATNDWDDEIDMSRPWRHMSGPRDVPGMSGDDAIAYAAGVPDNESNDWAPKKKDLEQNARWVAWRAECRKVCAAAPVEFLATGYDGETRYVLALKETVTHAYEWNVEPFKPFKEGWDLRGWEMAATLNEWAEKLGIPVELRGSFGWHLFATGGE